MKYAFPEDELRPLNCSPLTRDRDNPSHIEINDPLGNYSLTLVDSLSTLAILASSSGPAKDRKKAFAHFQNGVASLVDLYGDGTDGNNGQGKRARGFDLDSKVQVFETVIRGVGGLLSAHLFANGDLPIANYDPSKSLVDLPSGDQGIRWSRKFTYDGQLLRLAHDLASRMLPAFSTSTGIPYPRVNLRYGVNFYTNSCGIWGEECDAGDRVQCPATPKAEDENAETCSAGAGTLLLEFIVLSRLTGDTMFELVAKRAFWSIWERRTNTGLIGSNINAETGLWTNPYTGLGAGVDSFYEYAFKAYILLAGAERLWTDSYDPGPTYAAFFPPPLHEYHHDPESFLQVWKDSHDAINRHLRRGKTYGYPHFVQGDVFTGAAKAIWMDALSAFYPGLLVLAGDVEEAIENHVLFTALWSRYSAIPERWSMASGDIEHGLAWWLGRPEFIESNYYIYRATQDPWFLHVGEMAIQDIKRLCWVPCGLSGLQDVRTGERNNRMESFFLGETTKYLHLLFDPEHPLNSLDEPFVFSTEGHPLLIPKHLRGDSARFSKVPGREPLNETCPTAEPQLPFSVSKTAARPDLFHAAHLVRLQLGPKETSEELVATVPTAESIGIISPSNHTFYPWTLPIELIPQNGSSAKMEARPTFDITFPSVSNVVFPSGILSRVNGGILVGGLAGLRVGLIQDAPSYSDEHGQRDVYRIHAINHMPLGRDEKVFVSRDTIANVVKASDPLFSRVQDPVMLDIVIDVTEAQTTSISTETSKATNFKEILRPELIPEIVLPELLSDDSGSGSPMRNALRYLAKQMSSALNEEPTSTPRTPNVQRKYTAAITAQGPGAAPLPIIPEAKPPAANGNPQGNLPFRKIFVAGQNCRRMLPLNIPRDYQIIVMKRGGCSFAEKLANIPAFAPIDGSLQLVIVVSYKFDGDEEDDDGEQRLIRPLVDANPLTGSGIPRRKLVPMVMVGGGQDTYDSFKQAVAVGIKRRYTVETQGIPIGNLVVL